MTFLRYSVHFGKTKKQRRDFTADFAQVTTETSGFGGLGTTSPTTFHEEE